MLITHTVSAQSTAALRQAIEKALATQQLTGAVWSTVEADGRVTTDAAGKKNNATHEPLYAADKVHVGSVTKMILAVGVLQLATEGKLSLDTPVTHYLPGLPLRNPWQAAAPVTVRHLLDHTSGLSDLRLWHMFSTKARPDVPLATFYEPNPQVLQIHARPGTLFSYSNMGYTVLGMVVEAVTGARYEQYLDTNLLQKLGMRNSTFAFVTQTGPSADTRLAMGHVDGGIPCAAQPMYVRPAGQFTTTAADMGIFLRFMLGDGSWQGKVLVDRAYFAQVGKPAGTWAARQGLPYGYALGAAYRDRHGVLGLAHAGNILGYHAMVYLFPAEQKAFFISHNMDSETADYEVFNELLIRHLGLPAKTLALPAQSASGLAAWEGYYTPVITQVEPFGLLDVATAFTRVTLDATGATFRPAQKEGIRLRYTGHQRFMAAGKTVPSHVFFRDQNETPCITTGLMTVRKTNGWLILLAGSSLVAGSLGFVYLLGSGVFQLTSGKIPRRQLALNGYLAAVALLLAAVLLLLTQSFMTLGDPTPGSMVLALGTGLLPVLTLVSIVQYAKSGISSRLAKCDLLALVLVLQLSLVLLGNGLLPLTLWR